MKNIGAVMMSMLWLLWGCNQIECEKISREFVYQGFPKIESKAVFVLDIMEEMDKGLTEEQKMFLRCKVEDDFRDDNIPGGIGIWMDATWKLSDEKTSIGNYFSSEGIGDFNRVRIIGICYNRHLNGHETDLTGLLTEYKLKEEYGSMLRNVEMVSGFTENEKKEFKHLTRTVDSLMAADLDELMKIRFNDTLKHGLDKIVKLRNELFALTRLANEKVQRHEDCSEEIEALRRHGFKVSMKNFETSSIATRLIKLQQIRIHVLDHQREVIDDILGDEVE